MRQSYRRLIESPRVSTPTRAVLDARCKPLEPGYSPQALSTHSLETLGSVVARIIPGAISGAELAARLDYDLAVGDGDGWRSVSLPVDAQAYGQGLATLDHLASALHGSTFSGLTGVTQDSLLGSIATGVNTDHHRDAEGCLNAAQLRVWFEQLCADAVKLYVSLPDTLAGVGYSGIANGGDGSPKIGFLQVGIGEREDWEPTCDLDGIA